jgi:hypothetical protein
MTRESAGAGFADRKSPGMAERQTIAALETQAVTTAQWLSAYHRDGLIPPAEKIVLTCLRALQAIPEKERVGADRLMDALAQAFIDVADTPIASKRRANALLRIAGERVL